MVSAQGQMGLFSFESSGIYTSVYSRGFFNFWRPTCGVALWSKNPSRKKQRLALRVVNSGGGILEKEFEFKPSFDEYLKTMESVKWKKQSFKPNTDKSSIDYGEKDKMSKIVERDKVNMKSEGDSRSRSRSRKALPLKSEVDDATALRDEYKNFEKPTNLVKTPQMQIEERTKESAKLRKYDAKSQSREDNVSLMKFGGFPKEVNMSKVVKYNEVNTKNEGIRRTKSRKEFLEEGEDDDLKIERVAFKNFEESNDIVNKPRVSKMEMDERVQKMEERVA